jgi:hypothetical protein
MPEIEGDAEGDSEGNPDGCEDTEGPLLGASDIVGLSVLESQSCMTATPERVRFFGFRTEKNLDGSWVLT